MAEIKILKDSMDWFYFFIIFIAISIFFLDRIHYIKKNEHFTMKPDLNFPPKEWGVNYQLTQPKQYEDKAKTNVLPNPWGKGYGRFGATPPYGRCNVTVMGENCNNYPIDSSTDHYQTVCQKTFNTYPTGLNNLSQPINVMGRALGRVKQCRNLYDL